MSDSHYMEQEIETRRASVESAMDNLKQRMSIDQIANNVGHFLGIDDVRGALQRAGRQVQENPIPIGIIGLGVAWLLLSRKGAGQNSDSQRAGYGDAVDASRPSSRGRSISPEGLSDRSELESADRDVGGSSARSLVGRVQDAAFDFGDTLGQVPGQARDLAAGVVEQGKSAVGSLREAATETVLPLRNAMTSQPLLIGAAALAAGAVIGSALPRTRTEDRMLGPQRDRLVDQTAAFTRDFGHRAVEAVNTTYNAATRAARDEGLITEGQTIAEKVERVVTATVDAAKAQVDPASDGVKETDDPKKTARGRK